MTAPLFPIHLAEDHIRSFADGVERSGNTLRWSQRDGVTELAVTPTREISTAYELPHAEVVTLTHTSDLLQTLTLDHAAAINRLATLSAFLSADGTQPARFECRVGIFAQDQEAAERVYAPLVCMEAAVVSWHAACLARRLFAGDPDNSPLTMTGDPVPCGRPDFLMAKDDLDRQGLYSSLDETGLTSEFPWEPGAVSNVFRDQRVARELRETTGAPSEQVEAMGGRTSLLQIRTRDQHGLYGNGLLCLLELPLGIDGDAAVRLVDGLNRWESCGADLPPLFGSWCIGPRAPTFVSFVPNQFCVPGLPSNLAVWAMARHGRVREWLEPWPGTNDGARATA